MSDIPAPTNDGNFFLDPSTNVLPGVTVTANSSAGVIGWVLLAAVVYFAFVSENTKERHYKRVKKTVKEHAPRVRRSLTAGLKAARDAY